MRWRIIKKYNLLLTSTSFTTKHQRDLLLLLLLILHTTAFTAVMLVIKNFKLSSFSSTSTTHQDKSHSSLSFFFYVHSTIQINFLQKREKSFLFLPQTASIAAVVVNIIISLVNIHAKR